LKRQKNTKYKSGVWKHFHPSADKKVPIVIIAKIILLCYLKKLLDEHQLIDIHLLD
jgi:hypothetical protein